MQKPQILSLYGNVAIPKGWCSECGTHAFIIDARLQCCNAKVEKCNPTKIKRESEPEQVRRGPSSKKRKITLEEQDYRCFYCYTRFGSTRIYKGKEVNVRLVWDHQVPYAYGQNNGDHNFVAACQHCNGIKSSMMFNSIEEARVYLDGELKRRVSPVQKDV